MRLKSEEEMRTDTYVYNILLKELGLKPNTPLGKRAHGKFFFRCVNHIRFCKDPNCHTKILLTTFLESFDWKNNSELTGSFKEVKPLEQ